MQEVNFVAYTPQIGRTAPFKEMYIHESCGEKIKLRVMKELKTTGQGALKLDKGATHRQDTAESGFLCGLIHSVSV